MQNAKSVEVVVFKLKEDASRDKFVQDAAITQVKVSEYKGYLHRQLLEGEDGQWTDIVWWESLEDAMSAGEQIMQEESCMPFMMAIDETTMQMMHLSPLAIPIAEK